MFNIYNSKNPEVQFRYMKSSDYHLGVFDCLSQLTKSPVPSQPQFKLFLEKMQNSSQKHINIVGQDLKQNKIVAFGSIIICNSLKGKIGKIENIVTCKSARGKGYGKVIIQMLKILGWEQGCDMISLFCEQKNVKFYEKLGFTGKGDICMRYT